MRLHRPVVLLALTLTACAYAPAPPGGPDGSLTIEVENLSVEPLRLYASRSASVPGHRIGEVPIRGNGRWDVPLGRPGILCFAARGRGGVETRTCVNVRGARHVHLSIQPSLGAILATVR